jgi:glycosyltransferase involved in cell wall biosynthesis
MVIPNFLRDGVTRPIERPRRNEVVIGWVAAREHKADVRRTPIVKALRRLLADYPQTRVETAGVRLPLPADRYRHYSWVLVGRLPRLFSHWDIGIAPLSDTPFNRARSNVKLKEYAATGLPWVASPVGPYLDMLEEQGGWLVSDDEWYDALAELVEEPQTREELGRFGARWAATQTATLPENARQWEAACHAAVKRRAERSP